MSDDLIVGGERWRRDPDHPRLWSYVLRDEDGEDVLVDVEPGEMPLLDEIEELRRWKAEATHVLSQWDDVWQAAGSPGPLGSSKAAAVKDLLDRLRVKAEHTQVAGWVVLIHESGPEYVAYLLANMRRWRRVAIAEHVRHCTARHDCDSAVEKLYVAMLEEDDRG